MIFLFLSSLLLVAAEIKIFGLFPSFWLIYSYLRFSPIVISSNLIFLIPFLFLFSISIFFFARFVSWQRPLLVKIFLFALFFVSPWALQVISGSPLSLVVSPLQTTLTPAQYGFYTDVHRQADLVAGVPALGKLYYNKYLVIVRNILLNTASLLDPDRIFFVSSSGKAPADMRLYPQLTLLELPILVWGLYLLLKRKHYFLLSLPILAAFISSLFRLPAQPIAYQNDPGWLVFFILTAIVVITLPKIFKNNLHLILVSLLILLLRLTLVNVSFTDNGNQKKLFAAYSNLSQNLTPFSTDQKIAVTDRLGQPHVYLTYFGAIPLTDFRQSLQPKLPSDKYGLPQPPRINNYEFGSFVFDGKTTGTFVELLSNFPLVETDKSLVNKIIIDPKFEYESTSKTISDNLLIVEAR